MHGCQHIAMREEEQIADSTSVMIAVSGKNVPGENEISILNFPMPSPSSPCLPKILNFAKKGFGKSAFLFIDGKGAETL